METFYKTLRVIAVAMVITVGIMTVAVSCSTDSESGFVSLSDIKSELKNESESDASSVAPFVDEVSVETDVESEYDDLQKVFLSLSGNTTPNELESLISERSLFYSAIEYNKVSGGKIKKYKLAYNDGAAKQRYSDSGDYLEVSFDRENSDSLLNAQYVNHQILGYSALLYQSGTWFDFSEENDGDYSGYYIVDSFGRKNGITIRYTNGNKVTTINEHKSGAFVKMHKRQLSDHSQKGRLLPAI